MLLHEVVETSLRVASTRARLQKTEHLTQLLRAAHMGEVATAVAFLSGEIPGGKINAGPALVREAAETPRAGGGPALQLLEVQERFDELREIKGTGSKQRKLDTLGWLFSRARNGERDFLCRLIVGELRQGALEGVMAEAIAKSYDVPAAEVRRAVMFAGDMALVASIAAGEGRAGLARFALELFRPLQPMLAQPTDGIDSALDELGRAHLEFKLDGARVQIHKRGDEVKVFTRQLNEVTHAVPEIVQLCRKLQVRELVLDGEVIALRADGRPHPFQLTMRRFGRKLDVERLRRELPLSVFFFDLIHLDGETLIDRPLEQRCAALAATADQATLVPRILSSNPQEARTFLSKALELGHEGLMAKSTTAGYEAGGRGKAWLKIKPAHTLDLVVLAAEWGSGRRKGWLSNLHLAARDPDKGGFCMLGKTFKGLTDETLQWQTQALLEREIGRDEYVVHVRPELVVEIAVNELQVSRHYPGGLALRFARVKRYRPDKRAEDADTLETVRKIHTGEIDRRERR